MYFFKSILAKILKSQKKEQPEPSSNQVWVFPFDIADKYCTPVVFNIVDVKDDKVFFFTNFNNEIQQKTVQYFKENLEFQNFSC